MARQFAQSTLDALAAGHVDFRYLGEFQLSSGIYRLGNHTPGEYMTAGGENWYGLGRLVKMPDLTTQSGLVADQATIIVDGSLIVDSVEEYGDATSWLRDAFREDMINRQCTIYEVYQHTGSGAVLETVNVFSGPIDAAPLDLKALKGRVRIRSNRQAFGWASGRTRSDADQKRIDLADNSMRHVANLAASGGSLPWGYVPTKQGTTVDVRGALEDGLRRLF